MIELDVGVEFERLRPYIEAALEYTGGSHTLDDVRAGIEDGDLQLWPGASSVIVTEVLQEPQRLTLHFFLAGGNLTELEAMYPAVVEWGKHRGCTHATMLGRAGWTRSFLTRRQGWSPTAVLMEKAL